MSEIWRAPEPVVHCCLQEVLEKGMQLYKLAVCWATI